MEKMNEKNNLSTKIYGGGDGRGGGYSDPSGSTNNYLFFVCLCVFHHILYNACSLYLSRGVPIISQHHFTSMLAPGLQRVNY